MRRRKRKREERTEEEAEDLPSKILPHSSSLRVRSHSEEGTRRAGLPFSCRPFYLISKPGEVARRKAIFARGLTPGGRQRGW